MAKQTVTSVFWPFFNWCGRKIRWSKLAPLYHSHVLHLPNRKPFDNPTFAWPSFIGEFALPLVRSYPWLLYWFSFYGSFARFRVYTNSYFAVRSRLEGLRDTLGLIDKGEEKTLTLQSDLGGPRFLGGQSNSSTHDRAMCILLALKAVSDLTIDSVHHRPDGYWEFERTADKNQNPIGCHLFSVTHLFHNITAADGLIVAFNQPPNVGLLSYYYFWEEVRIGHLKDQPRQDFVVRL
jgi:hypothetical protein